VKTYWGTFQLGDDNGVEVTTASDALLTDDGLPYQLEASATCTVYLTPDASATTAAQRQASLTAKEMALRSALSVPLQDFRVLLDDGSQSSIRLLNAGSLRGVHVTSVNAPVGTGPQFDSFRTVTFTARASYPILGVGGQQIDLLSFTETLSFQGNGGPRTRMREVIDGPPVKQIVVPQTVCRATQSGSAVGFLGYPQLGGPGGAAVVLFPGDLINPDQAVSYVTPEKQTGPGGAVYLRFGVNWSYQYERTTPFGALPTLFP